MALSLPYSAGLPSFSSPQRSVGLKAGTILRQRVRNIHVHKKHKEMCRAVLGSNTSENATESKGQDLDLPPPGCSRFKVELSRPIGLVLEEDKAGNIFVAELVKDGNAEKSGLVDIGDQLVATSAIVYGSVEDYQGVKVRKGMQTVRLNVRGERFETVMAAIGTHPGHIKVSMSLQLKTCSLQKEETVLDHSFQELENLFLTSAERLYINLVTGLQVSSMEKIELLNNYQTQMSHFESTIPMALVEKSDVASSNVDEKVAATSKGIVHS